MVHFRDILQISDAESILGCVPRSWSWTKAITDKKGALCKPTLHSNIQFNFSDVAAINITR